MKRKVTLIESYLHRMIRESVKQVLNEMKYVPGDRLFENEYGLKIYLTILPFCLYYKSSRKLYWSKNCDDYCKGF